MKMRPAASNPSLLELRPGGLRDAVSQRASTPPRLGGSSQYGLACDNLLSVEIVTADGELRTASATENADLFWGVRGGGGNFGAVTSFRFRLYPVGRCSETGYMQFKIPALTTTTFSSSPSE